MDVHQCINYGLYVEDYRGYRESSQGPAVSRTIAERAAARRLYTFVLKAGDVTIDDIIEVLEMTRKTAYSDAGTLVELRVLTRDEAQKAHTHTRITSVPNPRTRIHFERH